MGVGIAGQLTSVVLGGGAGECLPDWQGAPKALSRTVWVRALVCCSQGRWLPGEPAHAHTSGGGLWPDRTAFLFSVGLGGGWGR